MEEAAWGLTCPEAPILVHFHARQVFRVQLDFFRIARTDRSRPLSGYNCFVVQRPRVCRGSLIFHRAASAASRG